MLPQLASGGCSDKPRKLRPASARMAPAKASDIPTMSGERTLGRMRCDRILRVPVPTDREASTKVSSFTARVEARTRRAKPGIITIVMASATLPTPLPSTPATAIASTSGGKASMASTIRMRKLSRRPPM
jgi:hypothetical protein